MVALPFGGGAGLDEQQPAPAASPDLRGVGFLDHVGIRPRVFAQAAWVVHAGVRNVAVPLGHVELEGEAPTRLGFVGEPDLDVRNIDGLSLDSGKGARVGLLRKLGVAGVEAHFERALPSWRPPCETSRVEIGR